jgi:hypothetical protein
MLDDSQSAAISSVHYLGVIHDFKSDSGRGVIVESGSAVGEQEEECSSGIRRYCFHIRDCVLFGEKRDGTTRLRTVKLGQKVRFQISKEQQAVMIASSTGEPIEEGMPISQEAEFALMCLRQPKACRKTAPDPSRLSRPAATTILTDTIPME